MANPISAINEELKLDNPFYQKFLKQKEEIQAKYPKELWENPISKDKNHYDRVMWKAYIKELGDLMYEKNGWFQQFIWDSYSDSDKKIMQAKARGTVRKGSKY